MEYGIWNHGSIYSFGTSSDRNGNKYEGDNQRTLIFADGDKYEGEYKNGKREGKGIMVFSDGHRY